MSNTNSQNNTSSNPLLNLASSIWQHSQQIIKGFSLVTLGIIGYSFLRPASNSTANNSESSAPSQSTDLTASNNGMVAQKSTELSNVIPHNSFSGEHSSTANDIGQTFISTELDITYPEQKNYIEKRNINSLENNHIKRGLSIQNPIGVTFPINTVTIYNQRRSSVAVFNDTYVVVWDSEGQDGSVIGIIAQRFDYRGNKVNSSFIANTRTIGSQVSPTIAKLADENFIIGWTGDSYGINEYVTDIYSQVFNNPNEKLGSELRNNDNTIGAQYEPKFTSLPNGGVLTAWISQDTNNRITYRLMDANANKIGVEQRVGMSTSVDQLGFGCTALPNNGFAIAWNVIDYALSVHTSEIFLQAFDLSGNQYTYPFVVNNYQINQQIYPAVTSLRGNKLPVSWISYGENDTNNGLYVRTYDTDGTPLTSDIKIDSQPFDISAGYNPLIAPLTAITTLQDSVTLWQRNSSFLIAWSNVKGIFGQLFDVNSSKIGRIFQISANDLDQQAYEPQVTELSDGNVIFTWTAPDDSGSGIFSRILVPEITLFAYNLDIPKTYTEDTSYQFSDLVVNPMLDADTVNATLTLSNPSAGSLSIESSNNITASFDSAQGVWQVQNAGIVDLNRIFEQLKFIPSTNYNSDFTIQVDLKDSNTNHTAYSNTLTMVGVPVNDVPTVTTNQLVLNQGDSITLGLNNLDASDVDNASTDFSFNINQIVQGQFENINNPGRGVTSFTYSQLTNSEIIFIHDNTRFAPAYQISVSDGNLTSSSQPATIDFNARPELLNNQFSIEGGQTVVLTQDNLKASDDHTAEGELMFMMSEITHGQFELVSAKGSAVTQFTQQQVIDNQVQFVHDASSQAPSFKTSVNDGRISSSPISVTVNFAGNNLLGENTLPLALGVSIGGAALLAGAGIGIWQGRKQQQLKREREQEPLANAVRTKLRVGNVDDFKSSQGRNYINFINTLKNELINLGIETEQMLPDETNELAGFISDAIKETMKENGIKLKKTVTGAIELNTQMLQTYASTIAAKAQEFKNDHPGLNTSGMGLKTINPVNVV